MDTEEQKTKFLDKNTLILVFGFIAIIGIISIINLNSNKI